MPQLALQEFRQLNQEAMHQLARSRLSQALESKAISA